MRRLLLLAVLIAVGATLAIWFADRPGVVTLQWAGLRFDTSIGVLFALVAIIAIGAATLYRFWRFLRRAPRNLATARHARRRRQGYRFLTQGMAAVAVGDVREAARLAKKADRLLQEPPLTMLLSAQAAQLDGDENAAQHYFKAMLDEPDMAILGVRGLLTQAIKLGDSAHALSLAERASALRPKAKWVVEELFKQQIAVGDWDAAAETMVQAERWKTVDRAISQRRRAVLAVAQCASREAAGGADKEVGAALKCAECAAKLDTALTPAMIALGRLLAAAGKQGKAARVLEGAWRRDPHPELATVYETIESESSSLDQVKWMQRLIAGNPDHVESKIALARVTLAADLWGEARRHLDAVIKTVEDDADKDVNIGARVYRLMADIELAEHGDDAAAGRWLAKVSQPDESWMCEACGVDHGVWHAVCGYCGGFDTLRWQIPRNLAHATFLETVAPVVAVNAKPDPS